MDLKITISIDDLHPEQGWGCEGDKCVEYLEKLHKEFGCKFNLFIPSNYHGKYPLSEHKEWVDFWKRRKWVEIAAHGHYHQCERDDIGECEFFELDTEEKALQRISDCLSEWDKVGIKPRGWRNPGWLAHPNAIKVLGNHFDYSAIHEEHNHGIEWDCKTIFGADGINETDIKLHDGVVMFQSHIAGDWNDNVWNEQNYLQIRESLKFLTENYNVTFNTIEEITCRKKVIYLIAVGNIPYVQHTYPLIQKYAEKMNADIRVFDDKDYTSKNYPSPNFLLFDVFKEFENSQYEKMLYMDVDIRILNHTPDIFEEVDGYGMVQDWKATKRFDYARTRAMQEWLDEHHNGMKINHYFNGGVIVSDKHNIRQILSVLPENILEFWKTTLDKFPHGFNQNILNYCIIKSGIEYQELPDKWNKCCRNNPTADDYFIHYVANKTQIETDFDTFKGNEYNPKIKMNLESLRYV